MLYLLICTKSALIICYSVKIEFALWCMIRMTFIVAIRERNCHWWCFVKKKNYVGTRYNSQICLPSATPIMPQ